MPSAVASSVSRNQVNRAGEVFRRLGSGEPIGLEDYGAAISVLNWFRAAHAYPLQKSSLGLRSMVNTAGCAAPQVSQRLKRRPTIIDKLRREPGMALARMQDIGGCRAVLADLGEVDRVHARLRKTGRIRRVRDYITEPAESGYRSLHAIVEYDGRLIEVQLRTQLQHQWAVTVEQLGTRLHHDIKSGEGPPEVHDLLKCISGAMSIEERGESVDAQTQENLRRLRTAAEPFLAPGRK